MKVCTKCKVEKEFNEFYYRKNSKDGYRSHCKICTKKHLNKDAIKKYCFDNKEKRSEQNKKYYLNNRDKVNKYRRNKKNTDPLFKLSCNIRSLILYSIKKKSYLRTSRTHQMLGCTFEKFKSHLESQFTEGMTWENQGKWHLDHIYPVSLATDEEHLIRLNHYTNFQPMWAEDNLKKSNKI